MSNFNAAEGPYTLTEQAVDACVKKGAIGNYAIGVASGGIMAIQYVGRSDTDLNKRLKDHIGEGYTHFKFSYATDILEAYRKECSDYHALIDNGKRLDNEIHPGKPNGITSFLVCPVCGQ